MELTEHIRGFILENFIVDGDGNLENGISLLEEGIIDSTGVLELVAFIEETYHIKVQDEELIPENLDSINNISNFIQTKLNASNASAVQAKVDDSLAATVQS